MSEKMLHRPTWAEIKLDYLAENFHSVKKFITENIKFMAVVKADAYGHGAVECAKKLEAAGIDWFGVALPEEGLELRQSGIQKPILCLGGFWSGQERFLIENDLTPVIFRLDMAEKLNDAAKLKNKIVDIHVKVDTGMGRIGVRFEKVWEFAETLRQFKNIKVDGIMTHFAAADNLAENNFTGSQIRQFEEAVNIFETNGFRPTYKDLANSPGAIIHKNSYGNMVRLGGVLYGLGGDILPPEIVKPKLKPVLSLHTRIAHLKRISKGETLGYNRTFVTNRDSLIATIPIGYQDGYHRSLSNIGRVIINETYVPVVGRISMDWTILDVTDVHEVQVDDEVVLIGEQNQLRVTSEELAKKTNTISYEITCGINRRVNRLYVGG